MEKQPKNHCRSAQALTPRAKLFVREYLKDFNATQAAIRAGYSPDSARFKGSKMLANVAIADAVQRRLRKLYKSTEVSVENTVRKLDRIASFDPASILDAQGRLLPIHQMPTRSRLALTGLTLTETTANDADKGPVLTRTMRFDGRLAALGVLARHLEMFAQRTNLAPDSFFKRPEVKPREYYLDDDALEDHDDLDDSSETGMTVGPDDDSGTEAETAALDDEDGSVDDLGDG